MKTFFFFCPYSKMKKAHFKERQHRITLWINRGLELFVQTSFYVFIERARGREREFF